MSSASKTASSPVRPFPGSCCRRRDFQSFPTCCVPSERLATAPSAPITPPTSAGVSAPGGAEAGGPEPLLHVQPLAGPGGGPSGYSPARMRHAYGFDQLTQDGTGQTIAIVDAYDDPNIVADLNTFSTQ